MLKELFLNLPVVSAISLIGSFLLVYIIIPKITWVVTSRELIDHPDERSAHIKPTPTMAGFSFFITIVILLFFIKEWDTDCISINYLAGLSLIFGIGLKDDLVLATPKAKLLGEIVAISFLIVCSAIELQTLDGFLGIYKIPFVLSVLLIMLLFLTIINSYNLIDGIDGLASIIGIVVFSVYGLIFYVTGLFFYFLLSLGLIGILLSYLKYNFSHTKKIFMGDTGSLIIGFSMGFLTLKILTMEASLFSHFAFQPENKLFVIAAILSIPLFDLFRVIGIRLLNGKSPFYPDRNHIHHVLVDYGWSHIKTTLVLGGLNYVLVILVIYLCSHFNSFAMVGFLLLIFSALLVVFHRLKKKVKLLQQT